MTPSKKCMLGLKAGKGIGECFRSDLKPLKEIIHSSLSWDCIYSCFRRFDLPCRYQMESVFRTEAGSGHGSQVHPNAQKRCQELNMRGTSNHKKILQKLSQVSTFSFHQILQVIAYNLTQMPWYVFRFVTLISAHLLMLDRATDNAVKCLVGKTFWLAIVSKAFVNTLKSHTSKHLPS